MSPEPIPTIERLPAMDADSTPLRFRLHAGHALVVGVVAAVAFFGVCLSAALMRPVEIRLEYKWWVCTTMGATTGSAARAFYAEDFPCLRPQRMSLKAACQGVVGDRVWATCTTNADDAYATYVAFPGGVAVFAADQRP